MPLLARRLARLEQLETDFSCTLETEKLESLKELAYGAASGGAVLAASRPASADWATVTLCPATPSIRPSVPATAKSSSTIRKRGTVIGTE